MNALLLAAGLGERLKPHTLKLAKPAIPLLNVPMMAFPLFFLERAGLKHLVVNTHHLPATIESACKKLGNGTYKVDFSFENEILGSGGGLAQARSFLPNGEDIVLVNSDAVFVTPLANPIEKLMQIHRESQAIATLLLTPFAAWQSGFGGVYIDDKKSVRRFSKTNVEDSSLSRFHFTGVVVASDSFYKTLGVKPSNILYDDLQSLIDSGARVSCYVDPHMRWFETGNVTDYLTTTKALLELLPTTGEIADQVRGVLTRYSRGWDNYKVGNLYSQSRLSPTMRSSARGLLAKGAQVAPSAEFKDFVVIGSNSQVPDNAVLEASVLGDNVVLEGSGLSHSLLI